MLRLTFILFAALSFVLVPVRAQEIDPPPPGYVQVDDMLLPASVVRGDSTFDATPWPFGVVPYVFDANLSGSNIAELQVAMAEIRGISSVIFIPRSVQTDYVRFRAAGVNLSAVGMIGGVQDINIVSWGSRYIIIHEIFHALGFLHEQSRSDRDAFVTINYSNIQAGVSSNFDKVNSSQNQTPYDFDSIMHYDQCAFSIQCPAGSTCGCSAHTIDCKPAFASFQNVMGNRSYLSLGDATGLRARYGTAGLPPTVSSIFPNSGSTASPPIQLDVFGSGFYPGSPNGNGVQGTKITWNGAVLSTNFVNTGHVRATIPTSLMTSPGTATVRVTNASPGFGTSLASFPFTVTCPPSLLTLAPFSPQTVTNTCSNFNIAASGNTFNVVAVSSPSDWDITIGGASAAAGGGTCDFVAGSGFLGAGTVTPTSGSILRYSGLSNATAEYVTTSSMTAGVPTIASLPAGSIIRAHHIYPAATGVYNITVAGPTPLTWKLLWKGNSSNFQWVSSTGSTVIASGVVGGSGVATVTMLAGPYVLAVCSDSGPRASAADYTINVCFSASNTVLGPSASSNTLVGASQGFCFPFSFTPLASSWNVVGVTSTSDWDISVGPAVSQQGGSNCDYVIADGRSGSVSPTNGTAARYSGTANGDLCFSYVTTMPSFPGFGFQSTYALTTFQFQVTTPGNYELSVSSSGTGWTWDLHAPAPTSVWRRKLDRLAGGFPANGTPFSIQLSAGWHALVVYRSGGDAPVLSGHTVSATYLANQPPVLGGISPSSALANSGPFTLDVSGSFFDATSVVRWDGAPLPTTFVDSSTLQAAVDTAQLLSPGLALVTVFTPGALGGTSNAAGFTIENAVPVVSALTPPRLPAGLPSTTMVVDGTGFVPSSEVRWDGAPLPTTFISDTQLVAYVDSALLLVLATVNVTVFTPPPGGGETGLANFIVGPTIHSISPSSLPIQTLADPPTVVTFLGQDFVPTTQIYLDGVPLATTYLDQYVLEVTLDPLVQTKLQAEGGLCLNAENLPGIISNSVAFPVGTSANIGTIRMDPLAPQATEAFTVLIEGGVPLAPFILVADAGLPLPTPLFPDPVANLCLQVTDLAGSGGPWLPLLDGVGLFGLPDGSALDAVGTFGLVGFSMPPAPVGVSIALQALHLDVASPAGFTLTWTRSLDL